MISMTCEYGEDFELKLHIRRVKAAVQVQRKGCIKLRLTSRIQARVRVTSPATPI